MKTKIKTAWKILVLASVVGLLASFYQTIERIYFAEHPAKQLVCNINSVFNCSNVFEAWQSSVFGFSNSLMCIVFFAIILGIGLAAVTKSDVNPKLRLIMQGFSLFFLGFGAWYIMESTFVIGNLCVFCLFCYSAVIAMNWAWLRINYLDIPLSKKYKIGLQKLFVSGADTFAWLMYTIIFAAIIVFHFWR